MNVIELFAGAGGLAQGFERTSYYQTVALYDIFEAAQVSYTAYKPSANYIIKDVCDLKKKDILKLLDGRPLHGILGGPPCQGFSMAGKKQSENEINKLVMEYARIVRETKPHFLLMENVPQLKFHTLFARLVNDLKKNYKITYSILNAARYGTPQTRHRIFILAYRKDYRIQPTFPAPTHGQLGQSIYTYNLDDPNRRVLLDETTAIDVFGADPVVTQQVAQQLARTPAPITADLLPLVTVGDAIGDLEVQTYDKAEKILYSSEATTDYQRLLRNGATKVSNCIARRHGDDMKELVRDLREGAMAENIIRTKDGIAQDVENDYYSQAYSRLHRAGLARTLTTYFQNAGSGRFIHYSLPRTLTIREAARLQGFPDDFEFHGLLAEQMLQIGNAVPLPLAEALGKHIFTEIGELINQNEPMGR